MLYKNHNFFTTTAPNWMGSSLTDREIVNIFIRIIIIIILDIYIAQLL